MHSSHIDFNLKRNSDFIKELTRLLDTSRTIKQEAHMKKILQRMDDEKHHNLSQQSSPALQERAASKRPVASSFKNSNPSSELSSGRLQSLAPPSPQVVGKLSQSNKELHSGSGNIIEEICYNRYQVLN